MSSILAVLARLYGLAEIVHGVQLHGFHSVLHLSVVRHDQERDGKAFLMRPAQQLRAVPVRQAQVGKDEVELLRGEGFLCRGQCRHVAAFHSLFLQPVADAAAENNVVLYDQYLFHSSFFCRFMAWRSSISFTMPSCRRSSSSTRTRVPSI